MKKLDARKLTPEIQQHNRDLAIRLFQQGKKRTDIAEITGVHYGVAYRWIKAWEQGGEAAIKQGQRGRRSAEQRPLTEAQESVLKKLICDKNPDQMKPPFYSFCWLDTLQKF